MRRGPGVAFTMGDGKVMPVAWRQQAGSRQRADGAWWNDRNGRWYENLDLLCTCCALPALLPCR